MSREYLHTFKRVVVSYTICWSQHIYEHHMTGEPHIDLSDVQDCRISPVREPAYTVTSSTSPGPLDGASDSTMVVDMEHETHELQVVQDFVVEL